MEVQRVEHLDRRVRRMDGHVGGRLEQRLGVVEDDLQARGDEVVGRLLRPLGRHREDADDDVLLAHELPKPLVGSTVTWPIGCPTFAGSVSTTAAMLIPCSAKIDDDAIAWPSRPAPTSATLCWPCVRRILRITSSSASIE